MPQLSRRFGCSGVHLAVLYSACPIPEASPSAKLNTDLASPSRVPSAIDFGANLIPNIQDPQGKDAQEVCPGYIASNVARNSLGLTATLTLAGEACNVYGNDISSLNLTVQYQSVDRLAVRITPTIIDLSNSSQYNIPDHIVHQPAPDPDALSAISASDLSFVWSNDPDFSFSVFRVSTGDTLFSTEGTRLVFEDQFVEFASALPENYNLYGLGETIHGLRLGNNFTKTIYAADVGDPIDEYDDYTCFFKNHRASLTMSMQEHLWLTSFLPRYKILQV